MYDIVKKNSRFPSTCHNCECARTLHENVEGTEKLLYCYYNNNLFSSKPCLIFKEKFIAQSLYDGITAFEKTEVPITIDKRTTIEERTTLCPGQGQKKKMRALLLGLAKSIY